VIKRITQRLNPRICRVAALPAPNDASGPSGTSSVTSRICRAGGEIVLFDRSWYKPRRRRARDGLFATKSSTRSLQVGAGIQRMLIRSGTPAEILVLEITDEEQQFRFTMRSTIRLKQWN